MKKKDLVSIVSHIPPIFTGIQLLVKSIRWVITEVPHPAPGEALALR